ncbi:MAG: hypothetical protein ACLFU7_07760 [Armatimonadota bacterium]
MGSFYTNVTLRGVGQERVAEYLAGRNRQVLVSPAKNGLTVVYDALTESQEARLLTNLARELSAQFDCPALAALNHDDDVLWLQLHIDGRLLDEYTSAPGYFTGDAAGAPEGGDAEALCEAFGAEDAEERVERILRREQDIAGYFGASERHAELAQALGMPATLVTTGYRYLTHGETPEGFMPQDFIHTGPVPRTAAMAPEAAADRGGPGEPPPPPPGGGPGTGGPGPGDPHVHIGSAPGGGCCGCLLAPLIIPLGLLLSAWSALVLRRHAEQMGEQQRPPTG